MDYLLDTHTFLWFINGDDELSLTARQTIEDVAVKKYISIASLWEIAVKISIGKLELKMSFAELQKQVYENGFEILPISPEHISELIELKYHHRDPFDRIIISQATIDRLGIITRDANFNYYKVKVIW